MREPAGGRDCFVRQSGSLSKARRRYVLDFGALAADDADLLVSAQFQADASDCHPLTRDTAHDGAIDGQFIREKEQTINSVRFASGMLTV